SLSSRFLQSKPKTKKNEEQSPSHSPDSLLCSLCSRLAKESARFVLNQPRGFRSRLVFGRGKRSSEEIARPRRRESLAAKIPTDKISPAMS
ncbi:unnamed protein product, partial [Linum tenue]